VLFLSLSPCCVLWAHRLDADAGKMNFQVKSCPASSLTRFAIEFSCADQPLELHRGLQAPPWPKLGGGLGCGHCGFSFRFVAEATNDDDRLEEVLRCC